MVLALFKPYTCVGDYVIPFAMLPLWLHLFKYLQQFYVIAVATVVSFRCKLVLAPLTYDLQSLNIIFFMR